MHIFSGLFKSGNKPKDYLSCRGYSFYFGGTTSGKAVSHADYGYVPLREDICGITASHLHTSAMAVKKRLLTISFITYCMMSQTPEITSLVF